MKVAVLQFEHFLGGQMQAALSANRSEIAQIESMIERAETLVLAARSLPPAERLQKLAEARALERRARAALVEWCARRLIARMAGRNP